MADKKLSGTKTEQNLLAAYAGESQARVKYQIFASQAKKEGYEQIAAFFEETSDNEKQHAKIWFKTLGLLGDTEENLEAAMNGEAFEFNTMYEDFARDAEEEGFNDLATLFTMVGAIEHEHEMRYKKLLENVRNSEVFKKDNVVTWQCRECGNIIVGEAAPEICPVCKHPQAYFQLQETNF